MAEPEIELLAIQRGSVTAPAGCGKTHLVAEALKRHQGRKPVLVLTHTNAGVAALRGRLDKAGVAASRYRLSTIDGFAMRLIATFPARSEHDPAILKPETPGSDYPAIRQAAGHLIAAGHISDVLASTYDRMFVDEYQDCSDVQHGLARGLAEVLPTCVLGDPLQGIFGFKGNRLVDWTGTVTSYFTAAGELTTPHRWINAGEENFGRWLLVTRARLLAGESIDLSSAPANVRHVTLDGTDDHRLRLEACKTKAPTLDGCVLILADARKRSEQQKFASQTPGAVTAENVDLTDLVAFASAFELQDADALQIIVEFAASIMTNVGPDDLLARVASLKAGRARRAASNTEQAALAFDQSPSYARVADLLVAINKDAGVRVHRPPILQGCYRMLQLCDLPDGPTLYDAAVQVRERARLIGRPLAKRTVGSTLLLKGLEADVSVILNADEMDARHLYVAMTRGARQLVVCSSSPNIKPRRG